MEMLSRDEERRLELDGVVWGLERALDLIDIAEEEQGQPAPLPCPGSTQSSQPPEENPRKARIK